MGRLRELCLFAGGGGGILGGLLLGWRTVCAVEIDPFCRRVLLARQRDGFLEPFPIWDDIKTLDGAPWRGYVDIVTGGLPCQDISTAGTGVREGVKGSRSGLWSEMARVVREVEPQYVLMENVPALTFRGLDVVLGDLASMGFDARWGALGTRDAGGPCWGDRLWIVAKANRINGNLWVESSQSSKRKPVFGESPSECETGKNTPWKLPPPESARMDQRMADRVDRTRAIGNGQVPAVVRLAWETLSW